MDYWTECIAEAFEDAGITATEKQIDTVASWAEGAHDNYGMAHGHACIPNPLAEENARLASDLQKEKEKIHCKECNGIGYIVTSYGSRSSESTCWKCRGEGRHSP